MADYDVFLKSLRKSEKMGRLNGHIVNLREDNEKLQFVLKLAKKEGWEVLERNIELMMARPNLHSEEYETTVDFLDACDALRAELQTIH